MARPQPTAEGERLYVVTGGCGFIGSHLVRRLLEEPDTRVAVVDSLQFGRPSNLETARDRVHIIEHRLGFDPIDELGEALSGASGLFHLAAEKHNQSLDRPADLLQANVNGTHQLFQLAAASGVDRIVFSSSLYACGRTSPPEMRESDLPQPVTVYGASKLAGEHLLATVCRQTGITGISLRYFFTYGPRQFAGSGYKSVIVKNFERILRGERPVIRGDGSQALDYIFVDDIVDATRLAMETPLEVPVLHVGSGDALSVADLTRAMLEASGTNLDPIHVDPDETAGTWRVTDPTLARKRLDWKPRISLAEGLTRTFEWLKEQNDS